MVDRADSIPSVSNTSNVLFDVVWVPFTPITILIQLNWLNCCKNSNLFNHKFPWHLGDLRLPQIAYIHCCFSHRLLSRLGWLLANPNKLYSLDLIIDQFVIFSMVVLTLTTTFPMSFLSLSKLSWIAPFANGFIFINLSPIAWIWGGFIFNFEPSIENIIVSMLISSF